MNTQAAILLIVWLGPFVLAIGLGLVALYFYGLGHLAEILRTAPREAIWMLVGGLAIYFLTGALMYVTCYRVMPREAFANGSSGDVSDGDPTFLTDLAAAEVAVCKLITRVDGFIQNDVGPAGQSDSQLIAAAQTKARDGVDMVECSSDASGDTAHRLTRLEETLRSFTGPELQRTHDSTVRCEGFQDGSAAVAVTPRQRLTTIQATIRDQQTRLLAPIDAKTEDLQRGNASDCDKRRAAARMTPPTTTAGQ